MPSQEKKPRRTPEQVIENLKAKQKAADETAKKRKSQLQAQIKNQQAKLATAARKEDTHCKIVVGALAIAHCSYDSEFAATLKKLIAESAETPETKQKILARL